MRFPASWRSLVDLDWIRSHRDAVHFTASSAARTAAQFIASLITVRLIAPEELGLWNTISLATTYALFLQAGVINGLSRELPFHLGADNPDLARRMAGTSQSYTAAGAALALLVGLVALVIYRGSGSAVLLSILAVTLVTAATFYQNYLTVTFRSKSSFLALAGTQFWTAALMLLTLPVIALLGYNGMLLRIVLVTGATLWLMHRVRPFPAPMLWDGLSFRMLMTTGLPIFFLSYIESSSGTVDRIVLLNYGGVKEVGYYALATYAWQALAIIPVSLGAYVYPKMTFSYGQSSDPHTLWRMAWKITLVICAVMIPLAIACSFSVPAAVQRLFPQYIPSIKATQILIFASVFYGAAMGVNALWSMKAWKYMVAYQLLGSAFRIAGPFAGAICHHSPLEGVAWGMLGAYAANFGVGIGLTYLATHRPTRNLA